MVRDMVPILGLADGAEIAPFDDCQRFEHLALSLAEIVDGIGVALDDPPEPCALSRQKAGQDHAHYLVSAHACLRLCLRRTRAMSRTRNGAISARSSYALAISWIM